MEIQQFNMKSRQFDIRIYKWVEVSRASPPAVLLASPVSCCGVHNYGYHFDKKNTGQLILIDLSPNEAKLVLCVQTRQQMNIPKKINKYLSSH